MTEGAIRVLGVDTSVRSSGVAVVEGRGNSMRLVDHGCLRNPPRFTHAESLGRLYDGVAELVQRHTPSVVAIEGVFFCKNVKTAVSLGEARGVVIAAGTRLSLPVFEYAPRRVKLAVVGHGSADKEQVRRMVMTLLGLRVEPPEDAGDAMAVAICHLHHHTRHAALAPRRL